MPFYEPLNVLPRKASNLVMNTRAAAVLSALCCVLALGRAQAERRGEAFTYRLSASPKAAS